MYQSNGLHCFRYYIDESWNCCTSGDMVPTVSVLWWPAGVQEMHFPASPDTQNPSQSFNFPKYTSFWSCTVNPSTSSGPLNFYKEESDFPGSYDKVIGLKQDYNEKMYLSMKKVGKGNGSLQNCTEMKGSYFYYTKSELISIFTFPTLAPQLKWDSYFPAKKSVERFS